MDLNPPPLTRYFQDRGVELIELLPGRAVPARFSDAREEHLATRRAGGLFDFSFMGCMEIRGRDSTALLERVQTRKLRQLSTGRLRYTLLLRDDGSVLNDATVWRVEESTWLLFVGRREDFERVAASAEGLDVEIEDQSRHIAVIALQGPRAREILTRCIAVPEDLSYYAFCETEAAGRPCLVARLGYSGEFGYEIVLPAQDAPALWQSLREAGAAAGLRECGLEAVDALRIEAGHILFLNELSLTVAADELGLDRLVEIDWSRTGRQGSRERKLVGLLLDGAPESTSSRGDHEAIVTSACWSPCFSRWIGMGFLPRDRSEPGARVRIGPYARATVARLPFYDPGKKLARGWRWVTPDR